MSTGTSTSAWVYDNLMVERDWEQGSPVSKHGGTVVEDPDLPGARMWVSEPGARGSMMGIAHAINRHQKKHGDTGYVATGISAGADWRLVIRKRRVAQRAEAKMVGALTGQAPSVGDARFERRFEKVAPDKLKEALVLGMQDSGVALELSPFQRQSPSAQRTESGGVHHLHASGTGSASGALRARGADPTFIRGEDFADPAPGFFIIGLPPVSRPQHEEIRFLGYRAGEGFALVGPLDPFGPKTAYTTEQLHGRDGSVTPSTLALRLTPEQFRSMAVANTPLPFTPAEGVEAWLFAPPATSNLPESLTKMLLWLVAPDGRVCTLLSALTDFRDATDLFHLREAERKWRPWVTCDLNSPAAADWIRDDLLDEKRAAADALAQGEAATASAASSREAAVAKFLSILSAEHIDWLALLPGVTRESDIAPALAALEQLLPPISRHLLPDLDTATIGLKLALEAKAGE